MDLCGIKLYLRRCVYGDGSISRTWICSNEPRDDAGSGGIDGDRHGDGSSLALPEVSRKSMGKYRGWSDTHFSCHRVYFCWRRDASFVLSTLCKCRSCKYLAHRLVRMEVAQR